MNLSVDLLTKRLRLREYEQAGESAQARDASDLVRVAGLAAFLTETPEEITAFWERVTGDRNREPRTQFELAVTLREGGNLIGGVRINVIDAPRWQGDIGYALHPDFRSRGYGAEAARAIVGFGFAQLQLHRIWATCATDNGASARVLEKIGMRREGTLPRGSRASGEQHYSYLYGMTVEAYQQLPVTRLCGADAYP